MTPGELRGKLNRRYPDVTITADSDGAHALIGNGDGSFMAVSVGPGRSMILDMIIGLAAGDSTDTP